MTVAYCARDLGAQQKNTFEKDFLKLNTVQIEHRFFFVTNRRTFDLMRDRYAQKIPGVKVELLSNGATFTA